MIEFIIIGVVVVIIIILSGIMSGSEAALLSLSIARIKEYEKAYSSVKKKLSRIHALESIKQQLQYYISVLVVLNNVVNIMGSILVGYLVTQFFGEVFLGAVTAILTFGIIIFSEVIPKVIGERNSLRVSLLITPYLRLFGFILRPVIYIIEYIVKVIVRNDSNENISKGEIREMAIIGTQEGSLDNYEGELIDNIFDLNETYVYDIMVPRHKMVYVSLDTSFQEIIDLIKKFGYTRFPVEKDYEIIGYIHIKDLFSYVDSKKSFNVKSIMRQLVFVPEVMRVVNVEKKLKSSRQHMCGIVNEHGEVIGIVTFEDIVEEIFGEISDEHDLEVENEIVKVKNGVYQIIGDCDIAKVNEELNLNINEQGEYSTLNGYIIDTLERIPVLKEEIQIEGGVIRILSKDKKKVLKVELEKHELSL